MERLEAWRNFLKAAKPKDWRWEPPSVPDSISEVAPVKPTEETLKLLHIAFGLLPDDEFVVLSLYLEGKKVNEIVPFLDEGNQLVVKLVINRAIERLSEILLAARPTEIKISSPTVILSWLSWFAKNAELVAEWL